MSGENYAEARRLASIMTGPQTVKTGVVETAQVYATLAVADALEDLARATSGQAVRIGREVNRAATGARRARKS